MKSFALITEGITDQVVLETMLLAYYKTNDEEPVINVLQPTRDATDEARTSNMGGWEKVLEYCSLKEALEEALAFNEYIIIQIDTDCGDHQNFGVPLTKHGIDRPAADIVTDTIKMIVSKIDVGLYTANTAKFIFAVAVHSLECWLIPLHTPGKHLNRVKSCGDHLNNLLASNKRIKYEKTYESYKSISKKFLKKKNIQAVEKLNESLMIFTSSLP